MRSGIVRADTRVSVVGVLVLVMLSSLWVGCTHSRSETEEAPELLSHDKQKGPRGAEVEQEFGWAIIHLDHVRLKVEIADTPALQSRGLMFREALADDAGMLFVYRQAQELKFWMLNTSIPLSIGFFDKSGILFEIKDMNPFTIFPQTISSQPARYALEVNRGWFARNNLTVGCRLVLNAESERIP